MWDERDEWLLVCLSGASDSSCDAAAYENLTRGKLVFLSSLSSKQPSIHECLINQEWQKGTTINKEMPISISYALFFWQFTECCHLPRLPRMAVPALLRQKPTEGCGTFQLGSKGGSSRVQTRRVHYYAVFTRILLQRRLFPFASTTAAANKNQLESSVSRWNLQ